MSRLVTLAGETLDAARLQDFGAEECEADMADSSDKNREIDQLQHALDEQQRYFDRALKQQQRYMTNALNALSEQQRYFDAALNAGSKFFDSEPAESWPVAADGTFSIPDIGTFQVHVDGDTPYVKVTSWHDGITPEQELRCEVKSSGDFRIPNVGDYKLCNGKGGRFVYRVRYMILNGKDGESVLPISNMPIEVGSMSNMPMSNRESSTVITMSDRGCGRSR